MNWIAISFSVSDREVKSILRVVDFEGLIFLTNDGDIVNKILRERNNHE